MVLEVSLPKNINTRVILQGYRSITSRRRFSPGETIALVPRLSALLTHQAIIKAVRGFEHPTWAVRNSSMMLFASIMQRAVGGAKNAGNGRELFIPRSNALLIHTVGCSRHPTAPPFIAFPSRASRNFGEKDNHYHHALAVFSS